MEGLESVNIYFRPKRNLMKHFKNLDRLGNIVEETLCSLYYVSLFVHRWKHCYGDKITFPGSTNVSQQIQSHFHGTSYMFPYISQFPHIFSEKHFFPITSTKTNLEVKIDLSASFWRDSFSGPKHKRALCIAIMKIGNVTRGEEFF